MLLALATAVLAVSGGDPGGRLPVTFQTPPDATAASVEQALRVGYRLIDTAASYLNEREVGEGIRRSGLDRSEVFIETKVWISDYGYDETLHAFEKSAGKLGVEQIDLLLLHQPVPTRFDTTVEAYRALETLLSEGRVRAIGVSNFMPEHLEALLERSSVVPSVNQVEVHPYFTQPGVQQANAARKAPSADRPRLPAPSSNRSASGRAAGRAGDRRWPRPSWTSRTTRSRVHGWYEHRLADAPVAGRAVLIRLRIGSSAAAVVDGTVTRVLRQPSCTLTAI